MEKQKNFRDSRPRKTRDVKLKLKNFLEVPPKLLKFRRFIP